MLKMKLFKFSKSRCPHCDIFAPIFAQHHSELEEKIEIEEVNLDEGSELKEIFQLKTVPAVGICYVDVEGVIRSAKKVNIGNSTENYSIARAEILKKIEEYSPEF